MGARPRIGIATRMHQFLDGGNIGPLSAVIIFALMMLPALYYWSLWRFHHRGDRPTVTMIGGTALYVLLVIIFVMLNLAK